MVDFRRPGYKFYAQFIPREFLVDTIHVHRTTYVHMHVLHKAAGNGMNS